MPNGTTIPSSSINGVHDHHTCPDPATAATPTNGYSGVGGGAGIVMMVQAAVIIGPKDSNLNYGTEPRNHIRSHTKIRCYVDRAQTNCHKQFSTYFCASFLFLDLRLFGQILLSVSVALISAKQIKFFRKITHTRCYVQNRWKLTMKHDKNNCRVHLRKFITICADQLQRLGVKKKK